MFNRRSLLAGASMTALALFMPWPTSSAPVDQEALVFVARHIGKNLSRYSADESDFIFRHALGKEYSETARSD